MEDMREREARPARGVHVVSVLGMLLIHAALWLAGVVYLVWFVPRLKRIFMEFGVMLPALAEWVLAVSDRLARVPFLLPLSFLALVTLDGAVLLSLQRHAGSARSTWAWFGAVLALTVVGLVVLVGATYLPLYRLQEALSK